MVARMRHLANEEVQSSNDSTYSLRLPTTGFLHTLWVTVRCTNGATSGRGVSPLDIADEIRVVGDGDERYFSLQPVEIEKYWETLMGQPLQMRQTEAASGVQMVCLPVMFGRMVEDKSLFLPLGNLKNPRLEVVYSPSIAADGGFATGTVSIDVTALWSPEQDKLNYGGTLVTRTIKAFTSVASGDDTTDIDIQDPIRLVAIYAYESATEDGTDVTRVRLEANSGEYDVWQGDWQNLLDYNRSMFWANIRHTARLLNTDAETWLSRLGNIKHYNIEPLYTPSTANDTFSVFVVSAIAGDRLTFKISDVDVTAGSETHADATADYALYVSAEGDSPSYFGCIPFFAYDEPQYYLNPKAYDKLRLILTQGGAGATVRNSIQFLKRY